jgi:short subunit dehydrogenase-like uncharacterized protein
LVVRDDRQLDVVVFGATGFVGRLVAAYLGKHAPAGVRIGLAGRSADRLASVRSSLGAAAADWPLLVADSANPASLAALAGSSRVVATAVGPYARYGLPLVEACARAGTHYADLTGEVLFVRDSIDRCHDTAVGSQARIVHSCGFDSTPSDLGVLLAHEGVRADGAGELTDTTLVVTALRGGVSGGTIASVLDQLAEMRADPVRRRIAADPYALSPDRAAEPDRGLDKELHGVSYDGELGGWLSPFVMAAYNTRIVRRSNALLNWCYGRGFRYREVTRSGVGPVGAVKAVATSGVTSGGTWFAATAIGFPPVRAVIGRLLPSPGQGPGELQRGRGFFRLEIHTRTTTGARYVVEVAAQGDPGYAATSVMLGESALCLALDADRLPARAGVLTPAAAMGLPLVDRLRGAGMTFDVKRRDAGVGG